MGFNKKFYQEEFNRLLKANEKGKSYIRKSEQIFKIGHFSKLAEASLLIAKHHLEQKKEPERRYWLRWSIVISYYSMLYAAKALILTKNYETSDHYATQIALGHLCIPDKIKKEDLEILNQAHKIFEDEYIKYFEDARKESHTARYHATKTYDERRAKEILENARKFTAKVLLML